MPAMKRTGTMWPKVLVGFIGICAAAWILVVSLGASATREWERYAASLRAKGQPLMFEEIEAQRAVVSEEKNSARIIEGLAAALDEQRGGAVTLESLNSGSNQLGDFFTGIYQNRIDRAREYVSKHTDILTKLEEIRDKPSGRFTIQYDKQNPIATLIPHGAQVRNASKLVRLNMKLRLVDGDTAGAFGDFELQCRLAASHGDEPILISRLVQIAIQAQAIATAEDMVRAGTTDDQSLKRMIQELQAMRQNGTLKWALLGERAFFVETCEALMTGRLTFSDFRSSVGTQPGPFFPQPLIRLPAFLMRSNELRGAQMHTSLIEADDPQAMLAAAQQMEKGVEDLPRTQVLVKIMMPSLSRAVVVNTKSEAQLDCAIAGLAAEQFRLAKGRLPDSLEELVPAYLPGVPTDPFDGKPIRLAKKPEGIVIYSVDEDRVDDGGEVAKPAEPKKKRAPDVGFRLNDATQRALFLIDDASQSDD